MAFAGIASQIKSKTNKMGSGCSVILKNQYQRAVFLDRDGVINRAEVRNGKPYPPENLAAVDILPGVPAALEQLHAAGFLLIVVTNQPDVARGTISKGMVDDIHKHLASHMPIDAWYTCFHDDKDGCDCRKPLAGSLLAAAKEYAIDLTNSYMVGDRWRDIEAGFKAGCKTIFIDYHYDEKQPVSIDFRAKSLSEAATFILGDIHASG